MINSQIVEFIKRQLQAGDSKEKIRNDLLSNGWTNSDVDEAISASTSGSTTINYLVKKTTKKIPIVVSLFLLILLGGGFIAFKVYKNDSTSKINTEKIVENNNIETTPMDVSNAILPTNSQKNSEVKNTTISQNTDEIKTAEATAIQMVSWVNGERPLIAAPHDDDILELGKPFTVVFAPVRNAIKYEITITEPTRDEEGKLTNIVGTLVKEVTTNTTFTIIVPDSNNFGPNCCTKKIVIKALDALGNVLNFNREYYGRTSTVPAISEEQIRFLPFPSQPKLFNVDKYVIDEDEKVTLTFGALSPPLKTRKVYLLSGPKVKIGSDLLSNASSSSDGLIFSQEAFTKELIFVKNAYYKGISEEIVLIVKYYDASGNELNSQGTKYAPWSWLSIKVKK